MVGNIISEPLLAETHHISEKRCEDSSLDAMVTSRRGGDHRSNLYWYRGAEGIMITDVGLKLRSENNPTHVVLTVSTRPMLGMVEEQVQSWLYQLRLTESECTSL